MKKLLLPGAALLVILGCYPLEPLGQVSDLRILWHTSQGAFDASEDPNKFDWVWSVAGAFEARYGTKVEVIVEDAEWDAQRWKLADLVTKGERCDLALIGKWFLLEYLQKNLCRDMSGFINPDDGVFYPGVSRYFSADGKVYGAGVGMQPLLLYYNAALFEAKGRESPRALYARGAWNWDAFRSAAKALSGSGTYGFGWNDTDWIPFLASNGVSAFSLADVNNPAGTYKIVTGFQDERAKAALTFMQGLYSDGAVITDGWLDAFKTGAAAMTFAWNGDAFAGMSPVTFVPLPAGPDGGSISGLGDEPQGFCMPVTCRNPQAAADFMRMSAEMYLSHLAQADSGDDARLRREAAAKSVFSPLEPFYGMQGFWDVNWTIRQGVRKNSPWESGDLNAVLGAANTSAAAGNPLEFEQ
ncbi:MAG: extracellular solute-binding protein [Treponema sp.]|jgi:ABC-type glycerol-3-phosphate transport system substrate-binding protein|nr:extracellular solute-binding protein [Treponema sp.]